MTFSDLEVIRISIPGRNKKETCNGKWPWRSKGSQVMDNTGSSNTKCESSAQNNDVTVNKKCFARCQAEEEVLAEEVEAVTKVEVQVGLQIKNTMTMSQQMTKMRKWSSHHTVQERNRVQHVTQSRKRLHMTLGKNANVEMIQQSHWKQEMNMRMRTHHSRNWDSNQQDSRITTSQRKLS